MRATLMYEAGDVRVEDVPDPVLKDPTDAIVRVTRSCICGSDLWPYQSMPHKDGGRRMGHEFIGIVEDVGADVGDLRAVIWSSRRSSGRTTPATSVARACRRRVATVAAGALAGWTADRARRCAFLRRKARW